MTCARLPHQSQSVHREEWIVSMVQKFALLIRRTLRATRAMSSGRDECIKIMPPPAEFDWASRCNHLFQCFTTFPIELIHHAIGTVGQFIIICTFLKFIQVRFA